MSDYKPDLVEFVKILLDEISEEKFSKSEQNALLYKLFELYNDGFWDTEANINIRGDVDMFIMGFRLYKLYKDTFD